MTHQPLLSIQDLDVQVDGKTILSDLSLDIKEGETHAIMGPNGTGKSTLAKVLMGHPHCSIVGGSILFDNVSLLPLSPEERAIKGLFLGFQYPCEIKGLSTELFLKQAFNALRKARNAPPMETQEFQAYLAEKMTLVGMKSHFQERDLNYGFSGGEKKKNEILQMAVLDPKLAILDEIDSGLDIDALKAISHAITCMKKQSPKKSFLLITHYPRILEYIHPDIVHVMMDHTIVKTGDLRLAKELEVKGYEWVKEEMKK